MPHNPLTATPLQSLFNIKGWGVRNFQGQHFSIKFRVNKKQAELVAKIQRRNPEMMIHVAETTDSIIFGGTFSCQSRFLDDCKLHLKLKVQ